MSAFAAFKPRQKKDDTPKVEPLPVLLEQMATSSNFVPSVRNTVFRPDCITYGLKKGEYLLIKGNYSLRVLNGTLLINNLHVMLTGGVYRIVTNSCESLPVISCNQERNEGELPPPLIPGFDALLEVSNLENGLSDLGDFYAPLQGHFHTKTTLYTFELLENNAVTPEGVYSVHFDSYTHRHLKRISKDLGIVVVFGSQTSGKTTVAKTLINHLLLSGNQEVSYLDLDVESANAMVPGCLSLTVHDAPVFGALLPFKQSSHPLNKNCYWGLDSFLEMPQRYIEICNSLIRHYHQNIKSKGIPLVVRYPSYIKGFGNKILVDITEYLKADQLVYMSHHNATELDGFEADAFEAQDNPDAEVVAEFRNLTDVTILRGTRRSFDVSKKELLVRNKLLYFHQVNGASFDFRPILSSRPLTLSFDYILAFCVIDYNIDDVTLKDRVHCLAEASVMGVFAHHKPVQSHMSLFINGSDFISLDLHFLCLSMVHSVDYRNRQLNLYLPQDDSVYQAIQAAIESGSKLIFARGEGKIPLADMIPPAAEGTFLPYVDSTAKNRIGGVWKPRKGISRKSYGK